MTIKEDAERYRIPAEILNEYESWGFCGKNDGNIGERQYDQTDIERLYHTAFPADPAKERYAEDPLP